MEHLSPEQIKEVQGAIKESAGSKTRAAAERDLQKDIRNNMKEEFGIEPKSFTKLVNMYFEQNKDEVIASTDELIETYEGIFGSPNGGE